MPAFPAEFGMPVRVDLVSSAPRKSERFYRELAREATDYWERFGLVDQANAIRPRTTL